MSFEPQTCAESFSPLSRSALSRVPDDTAIEQMGEYGQRPDIPLS